MLVGYKTAVPTAVLDTSLPKETPDTG
uniref:Uncharacterized protein n=1 Tax=Anguilla anguilla TaxID=7936 RepID=A0A0E9UIY0_ANGAN